MIQPIYTTFQISHFCSVDITTVMSWIDEGKLPAYKTPGGHRRVLQANLLEFLHKYNMPIPTELTKAHERILVVDDDALIVKIVTRTIKKMDPALEIETAGDGFVAGRKLESFDPDLVILDLTLPGVDGFHICRNIRSSEKTKDVKILAMTGHTSEAVRKKIMDYGADDFMGKPFSLNALSDKVAHLLNFKGAV
jgi:excisionase family DNA binding protein